MVVVALLVVAGIGGALACGPDFPWQLLNNRDQTVSDRVELNFAFEATHLVDAPGDGPRAVERDDTNSPEAVASEREEVRSGAWRGLLAGAIDTHRLESKLDAARAANDGDAALLRGCRPSVAVVTYIAGAIEFRAGRLDAAMGYFEAIDRLPSNQRQIRVVAAAYMRGRIQQRLGSMQLARAAFQAARQYDRRAPRSHGARGREPRVKRRVRISVEAGLIEVPWPVPVADADEARFAWLIADAVRLYADQAARGLKMALLSLNEVVRRLISRDELKRAVADPFVRRLLVAYVASARARLRLR
jgi:tetratricopeptide (TPR) repeat protein